MVSRLSRADWAHAALEALARGGLAAVAVEPIAAALGTTKGSFYWHFRGRDELISAALELWHQTGTTEVIAELEATGGPAEDRLRRLFATVFAPMSRVSADLALLADAGHPLVAPVLAQVSAERLGYLVTMFRQLGFTPARARRRALFAYSAYVGQLQLIRSAPELLPPAGAAATAYAEDVLRALLIDQP
jgi:AcrR family transcriptional regulator